MRKIKNNYVPAEYGGYLFPKSCLPDILPGDRGKVLTVNESETAAEWAQSGGGGLVVYVDDPVFNAGGDILVGGALDHTWNQINSALRTGIPVQIVAIRPTVEDEENGLIVIHVQSVYGPVLETGYVIDAFAGSAYYSFVSESADGYPEYSDD